MVKKINKKITHQLAPQNPEKAMANKTILATGAIAVIIGLLILLLGGSKRTRNYYLTGWCRCSDTRFIEWLLILLIPYDLSVWQKTSASAVFCQKFLMTLSFLSIF